MLGLGDNDTGGDRPIVKITVPTEFPHNFHVYASYMTCGLWLPIYVLHYLFAKLTKAYSTME